MIDNDELLEVRALLAGARPPRGGDGPPGAFERAWRELELPAPAPAPPGFARRVAARAVAERDRALGLPLPPPLARLAAAAAVVAGVAGGAGLGLVTGEAPQAGEAGEVTWAATSFAEELYDGLEAAVAGDEEAPR